MPSIKIRSSGPLEIAEIDCHGCDNLGTLLDKNCRGCVLKLLSQVEHVDQVVLKRVYRTIYSTGELSEISHSLAKLKRKVLDYRPPYLEEKRCKECVDERTRALLEVWPSILENPHSAEAVDKMIEKLNRIEKKCIECTKKNFLPLLESIKSGLLSLGLANRLARKNFDELFNASIQPFFISGIWRPPKNKTKMIDCYRLERNRGMVRIYEQRERDVLFYEIDLPEFKLPAEHLQLLDAAFRAEISGVPEHAKFAYPTRTPDFSSEWYSMLLHALRGSSILKIPADEIQELAECMSNWLAYRILEPLSHDENLTDIYISAPPESLPIYVVHERWGTCESGIFWTTPDLLGLGEILASRLGTSFDEVRPQLDAEISELGMRLFLSRHPAIWQNSVAIAVRKRRRKPWTQPLFLERRTLTPLASSIVSNLIRLGASAFVIGEKGSAKTSQIETLVPEIGKNQRIICFQDTEELHFEDFVLHGYKLENVRVTNPEHLQRQIDAFLRGGQAHWLITEVRSSDAVKATLGAAARQGSQPLVASFHARGKNEMFDLLCHIMGFHPTVYKYIDLVISTAHFQTSHGSIRRIVEVAEILKEWDNQPEYIDLFTDDRKHDILKHKNFLSGDKRLLRKLNSYDLTTLNFNQITKKVSLTPAEEGGSQYIQLACKRLAIEPQDMLAQIISEAMMKSDILFYSNKGEKGDYLELPFVSRAYSAYFSMVKRCAPDYKRVRGEWRAWMKNQ
ncbi:MAG: hypothetical protein APU95_01440 [Hadesarchaea archaeon YNP_N21]|nr:MAG: hypothetical protein APU95_01440 [Hadesarchaea archaeon YNP_N21]